MFKPVPVFIGWRYSLSRKNSALLSFTAQVSMLGVALGVAVLIVALSVMNGSIAVLRADALKAIPHVLVSGTAVASDWRRLATLAEADGEILAAAPVLEGDVLLRHQGRDSFARLRGVVPELEARVANAREPFYDLMLEALADNPDGILLGGRLAGNLGIFGAAEVSALPLHRLLRRHFDNPSGLQVTGIADFGSHGSDAIALVNLALAMALFGDSPGNQVQLRLKVADLFAADRIAARALAGEPGLEWRSWQQLSGAFFSALRLEKIVTGFMLLMIVAVGAVNIVSTLVMTVSRKRADIAILRAMGASESQVTGVFLVQGAVAGLMGTALGVALGLLLAANLARLSYWAESALNWLLPSANVYFISHLEVAVRPAEVALVCALALLISVCAAAFPAWRAGRLRPVEILRHE